MRSPEERARRILNWAHSAHRASVPIHPNGVEYVASEFRAAAVEALEWRSDLHDECPFGKDSGPADCQEAFSSEDSWCPRCAIRARLYSLKQGE